MVFGRALLPKVLDGSKTVTRRPVKITGINGDVARDCRYKVGRTYAVQPGIEEGPGKGRGGKGIARIRVLDVRRQPISFGWPVPRLEARREGFEDFEHFRRYWIGLYGSYDPEQLVDRIEFELLQAKENAPKGTDHR